MTGTDRIIVPAVFHDRVRNAGIPPLSGTCIGTTTDVPVDVIGGITNRLFGVRPVTGRTFFI